MTEHFDAMTQEYIDATFGTDEPQCFSCIHYLRGAWCEAYPAGRGIPDAIFENEHDHREPYEGDNGVTFEPA